MYEILKCDHSNESYWAVISCGGVYYAAQGGSHFTLGSRGFSCAVSGFGQVFLAARVFGLQTCRPVADEAPRRTREKTSGTLGILTFESVDKILKCDHSSESYWAVLSYGTAYYTVQGGSNFQACAQNPKLWPFKWNLFMSILTCIFYFVLQ